MSHKNHKCDRHFSVTAKGWIKLWFQVRKYTKIGHVIFDRYTKDDGTKVAILSTRLYPGSQLARRKL